MVAVLIILMVLLPLLVLLLWAPLAIEINSRQSVYRIGWWYLFRASVLPVEDDLLIDGRILFFRKRWSVMELLAKRREKKERKREKQKEKKQKRGQRFSWLIAKKVLATTRVERFDVTVDTGDVIWNAIFFPLAETLHYALRMHHPGFRINFVGENHIDLKITNSAGRIAWALTTHK